jgi:Rieske Fe-S protein
VDDQRRRFCQLAGVAVVASALPQVGCLGSAARPSTVPTVQNGVVTVPAQPVAMNDVLEVRVTDLAIDICRDAGGLYAMSAYCTHAHCIVQFETPTQGDPMLGFICNCHDSAFDYNGKVINPPAPQSLDHYQLTIDSAGNLIVDTTQIVNAGARTPG